MDDDMSVPTTMNVSDMTLEDKIKLQAQITEVLLALTAGRRDPKGVVSYLEARLIELQRLETV